MTETDGVMVALATYNEAATIDALLRRIPYPVILVDDSSDGTDRIAAQHTGVTVIHRDGKQGIASAYLLALQKALDSGAFVVVQMDAGGTHNPDDMSVMLWHIGRGADLVIGSRFVGKRQVKNYRSLVSLGAAWLMRRIGIPVADATSGYRCWRASFLRTLDFDAVRAEGFAFQLELLAQAARVGGKVREMPIPYRLTGSTFRWGMVWEALRVWWRLAQEGARRADHARVSHL